MIVIIPDFPFKSTRKKGILINFILDGSGSMNRIANDAVGGFNGYIDNLRGEREIDYYVSLTVFDTRVEKRYVVTPINQVEPLTRSNYPLGGGTALLDAQAATILEAERILNTDSRIDEVITVTFTDGEENASKEYKSKASVAEILRRLTATGKWTFVYLGANQDAFAEGGSMGYSLGNIQNYQVENAKNVFANLSVGTQARARGSSAGVTATMDYFKDANIRDVNEAPDLLDDIGWAGDGTPTPDELSRVKK